MTREEEMWKSVEEEHGELSRREAMVALTAMEWANKTMLDNACEWLKENMSSYVGVDVSPYYIYDDDLVEDFKNAMKGE